MGFPPFPLIASGMIFVVMDGAECDGEFVDLISSATWISATR